MQNYYRQKCPLSLIGKVFYLEEGGEKTQWTHKPYFSYIQIAKKYYKKFTYYSLYPTFFKIFFKSSNLCQGS